ncbi:MAG: Chorismate synthase [Firmicutes bacterium]|nr:Chorismate synthase [Bacillota bacterium]
MAKQVLAHWGIEIYSRVLALGPLALDGATPELALWRERARQPYGVGDKELQRQADEMIARCRRERVSVGGIFEVAAFNVPVGWGSYVHWDRRLDAQIAGALMSIPGIKGVEFGQAFALAVSPPGTAGDELAWDGERGWHYVGNVNAGLAGGTTTGQPILVRCAVKPIPTLMPGLTADLLSKKSTAPLAERSDTTMVPAAAVVAEHVLALSLLVAGHSAPDRY